MKTKLLHLIEVRKLITLAFALLFIYLAVRAQVNADFVTTTLTMVFGYYFGRATAADDNKKEGKS